MYYEFGRNSEPFSDGHFLVDLSIKIVTLVVSYEYYCLQKFRFFYFFVFHLRDKLYVDLMLIMGSVYFLVSLV
jgi:hypothetical protein